MALIQCPECGKEVSDKSKQCIHCGYPFENTDNILYDVIYRGFPDSKTKAENQVNLIGCIRRLSNGKLGLAETKRIIDNPPYTLFKAISKEKSDWILTTLRQYKCKIEIVTTLYDVQESDNSKINDYISNSTNVITCPRCGSNQITTGQRGFSLMTGFIGANKTVNRCAKCGHSWQPS